MRIFAAGWRTERREVWSAHPIRSTARAGGFGLVDIPTNSAFVTGLADLALFTVLFTDGRRADLPDRPQRALPSASSSPP
jgi:hypothetical protein